MKINILDLISGKEKCIEAEYTEVVEKEKFTENEIEVIAPVNVYGKVTRVDDVYRFEGSYETTLELICDRCLESFLCEVEGEFAQNFMEGITDEDKDILPVIKEEIDLTEILVKSIIMNVPLKRVCSDDCSGINYKKEDEIEENENLERSKAAFGALKDLKF